MLPQFQRLVQDSTSSPSLSTSLVSFNPPRYYEDLLSSSEADRTFTADEGMSTPPSSPAPLIIVSVPLPSVNRAASPVMRNVVGLVRSPTRISVRADFSFSDSSASDGAQFIREDCEEGSNGGAALYVAQSGNASSDGEDSTEFECPTITTTSNYRNVSTSAARTAGWGVLWAHVFPRHMAGYLAVRDVVEVGLVCRCSREAVRQPWVWRSLAVCHYAVHPGNVEHVFDKAAQQWAADDGACVEDERYQAHQRLLVCEHVVTAEPNGRVEAVPAAPCSQPQQAQQVEDWRTMSVSTSTTPWLMRQSTHSSLAGDGAEMSDSGEEEVEDAEAEVGHFNTTQPPTLISENDNDEVALRSMTAPPCPAAAQATTRPALASGSRYLWQIAAAAMPSPSSPVASPLSEDDVDGEDDDQANALTREGAEAASDSMSDETPATMADPADAMRQAATMQAPPLVALCAPKATGRPPTAQPPLAPACAPAAVAAAESEGALSGTTPPTNFPSPRTAAESKKSERNARAHERLPPPSPAQLDCPAEQGPHQLPLPGGEEGGAAPPASFSSPTFLPHLHHPSFTLEVSTDASESVGDGCVECDVASPSPSPALTYTYTLCRATAERSVLKPRPEFPWHAFTRYLHVNRVHNSLARWVELSRRAREELCRGAWDSAYGSLSHIIHALFQQGSCRGVEHLLHLAQALVRRASLCRHRGHVHPLAAFTDLCTAALLCPQSVSTADMLELSTREEFCTLSPESWMQSYEAAARVASPVALLGSLAQVPTLFPQHRSLCFSSAVLAYMRAHRVLGQSLTHLLARAAEWATPGTEEVLLVQALRETAVAQQSQQRAHLRKACATVDYARSLASLSIRSAVDTLSTAWVRDCFASAGAAYGTAMLRWISEAPEALAFARATALDVRWLAWLTCEVQAFVYKELTGTAPSHSVVSGVVLSVTSHDYADGLVRIATQYANYDVRVEDLWPPLPRGAGRRRVTQHLLHNALALRPLHPTAALLLSRVYAAVEEEVPTAHAVLTDCIHQWASRFALLSLDARTATRWGGLPQPSASPCAASTAGSAVAESPTPYLHRRERSPEVCFIPAELLVGRNRCLQMVADLAEATEQHPSLSYPYQMRAAMAMDRGYCLAAVVEMGRIMALSLDVSDVALRVRFLQDTAELHAQRAPRELDAVAATPTSPPTSMTLTPSSSMENVLQMYESAPAATAVAVDSPSHQLLLPIYQAWLSRMSGLLALLREPELPIAGRDAMEDLASSFCGSLSSSRFFSRELPSAAPRRFSGGHVSRVASLAVSDADGDGAWLSGGAGGVASSGAADAAHIRAFLEDLVSTTSAISPAAAAAS